MVRKLIIHHKIIAFLDKGSFIRANPHERGLDLIFEHVNSFFCLVPDSYTRVFSLGCGLFNDASTLAKYFKNADVIGIDRQSICGLSSNIDRAKAQTRKEVTFHEQDLCKFHTHYQNIGPTDFLMLEHPDPNFDWIGKDRIQNYSGALGTLKILSTLHCLNQPLVIFLMADHELMLLKHIAWDAGYTLSLSLKNDHPLNFLPDYIRSFYQNKCRPVIPESELNPKIVTAFASYIDSFCTSDHDRLICVLSPDRLRKPRILKLAPLFKIHPYFIESATPDLLEQDQAWINSQCFDFFFPLPKSSSLHYNSLSYDSK